MCRFSVIIQVDTLAITKLVATFVRPASWLHQMHLHQLHQRAAKEHKYYLPNAQTTRALVSTLPFAVVYQGCPSLST